MSRQNINQHLEYLRATARENKSCSVALQRRVIAARKDGVTVIEIAKAIGVSRPTVYRMLSNTDPAV